MIISQYYQLFLSKLIPMLNQTQQNEHRKINGMIIETIASIATAVGSEIFHEHAHSFIETIFQIKATIVDADDPRVDPINQSLLKIVQVMKDQFAPYFGRILPDLMKAIAHQPKLEFLNCFALLFSLHTLLAFCYIVNNYNR